jgi:2-polyprenyl-3-methyl-5-hydroxy-6-metoxy-1,4-benzoquinol methylase
MAAGAGVEIRRPSRTQFASVPVLSPPSREYVEQAKENFSVSFGISRQCSLTPAEIEEGIKSFRWHYAFEFGDRLVEADWKSFKGLRGRHYQRYLHIFPSLLSLTGGTLAGKTVLDIGCNCGFWSLQARNSGADSVLGVEASERNVEQGRFILDITGIDGIRIEQGTAYDVSRERHGEFDVVFFFGLLYHLEHPVLALERLYDTTRGLAVIDTTIVRDSRALCRIKTDAVHDQNYPNRLAMVPSLGAVAAMLEHVGFRRVVLLPNEPTTPPRDYVSGSRVTFIAEKEPITPSTGPALTSGRERGSV